MTLLRLSTRCNDTALCCAWQSLLKRQQPSSQDGVRGAGRVTEPREASFAPYLASILVTCVTKQSDLDSVA